MTRKPIIQETRQYKILRIILSIVIFALLALSVSMFIVTFVYEPTKVPAFISHYGVGLSLIAIGISAILMTILNKYNVNASDRGDRFILFVGLALIIFGIGTIIFSYL